MGIALGLCMYIKKIKATKHKMNQFEMTGCESLRSVHSGMCDIASNENQDRKRNESEANEEMYDAVITPQHRESDSNEMYKNNEETTKQIETQKSENNNEEEEELYIEQKELITTATVTNDQNTIEGPQW